MSRHPILIGNCKVLTPIICTARDIGIQHTSNTLILLGMLVGLACDIMYVIYGWLSPVNTVKKGGHYICV